jgi:hypothetical protein
MKIDNQPVKRSNLSDSLVDRLLQMIRSESYLPGDRLPAIMETASRLSLTALVTTCLWNGADFNRTETTAAGGSEFVYKSLDTTESSATQDFLLKLTLAPDRRSNITFYRIRSRANISDLRSDIRDLNTEDDSDPRNVEKTYRLSSLIISLTEAHLKEFIREQSLPRLYLTVENK